MTANTYDTTEGSSLEVRLVLSDEDDQPVAAAAITAVTVSLFNDADDAIINSRTVQDVFGVNGGAVATQAHPVRITTTADHGLNTGERIYIDGVVGMTELNERTFTVRRVNDTKVDLLDEDGTLHTAYSSVGTVQTGRFTLQLDPADNAIIGTITTGETEAHGLDTTFTYSGKTKTHPTIINVLALEKIT
jgi:hypothetical protein